MILRKVREVLHSPNDVLFYLLQYNNDINTQSGRFDDRKVNSIARRVMGT